MPTGGLAVYARLVGGAGAANVGYAIARPFEVIGAPTAIFGVPSRQDWEALPWPVLGGVAFDAVTWPVQLAFGVWPMWGPHSRHLMPPNVHEKPPKPDPL